MTLLEDLFFRQLESHRKNGGKSELREEDETPGHLMALVSDILRLDALKEAGATFAYPDALAPIQWLGLEVLINARRRSENNGYKERQQKAEQQRQIGELQRLSHS